MKLAGGPNAPKLFVPTIGASLYGEMSLEIGLPTSITGGASSNSMKTPSIPSKAMAMSDMKGSGGGLVVAFVDQKKITQTTLDSHKKTVLFLPLGVPLLDFNSGASTCLFFYVPKVLKFQNLFKFQAAHLLYYHRRSNHFLRVRLTYLLPTVGTTQFS